MKRWIAILTLITLGFLPGLNGCKMMESSEAKHTEDILSAAGFKQLQANTPERSQMLQTMKPRTFHAVEKNGNTYYVYPDPTNCNCLYSGTETQYQAYKKMAFEQEIAEDNLATAEDYDDASMDWGIWGPVW